MNQWRNEEDRRDIGLREHAQVRLAHAPAGGGPMHPGHALLRELQAHQVELGVQNEELKRAQLALEEARDRYLDLYDFAPVGYIKLTEAGLIAEANLTGAELLGEEQAKLVRHSFELFVSPGDRDRWQSVVQGAMRHATRQRAELTLQRPDGSLFHARLDCLRMESGGQPVELRIALADISERKAAEAASHASEERYRSLFSGMTEGFALHEIICDEAGTPCDYRFLEINPSFARLTGLKPDEVVGRTFNQVLPTEDRKWVRIYGEVALTGIPVRFVDHAPTLGKHYEVYAYRPAPKQFAVLFTDVTERIRTEQALRDNDQRKDEFLAMLAHELRNPLTPIRNAAHVIGRLGLEEPRLKWAQKVIETQTTHLTRMVDDLLDVSRIVRGKIVLQKEAVDFADLVETLMDSARLLAETKGHQLSVRLPEQPVWLEGDPVRLSQMLFNLLDNAFKYTPDGGRIEFDARKAGREIEIRVSDNGAGIPAALLPRVFDLFQQGERTLDRAQGGLGIGLTLVQRLAGMHGGRVEAHSEGPGRGATFTTWLPIGATTFPAAPVGA